MIDVVVALCVKYLISMIYEISRSDYHLNDSIGKTFNLSDMLDVCSIIHHGIKDLHHQS